MEFASLLQLRLKGWLARGTSRDLSCRGSRVGDQKERGFNFKESKSFGSQVSVRVRERGRETEGEAGAGAGKRLGAGCQRERTSD